MQQFSIDARTDDQVSGGPPEGTTMLCIAFLLARVPHVLDQSIGQTFFLLVVENR